MIVEPLSAALEPAYDQFVASRPEALLSHSLRYRDLLLAHLGCEAHYLVAREQQQLRAVMPLMASGAPGARVYNSLPFYGSNGGVLTDDEAARRALLDAYAELATDAGTLSATVVGNPFAPAQESAPVHNLVDRRISQWTALDFDPADEQGLMATIDASARRNVRKARSAGISVDSDADQFDLLGEIHRENIEALGGLSKPQAFFDSVASIFEPQRDYDLWVARLDGTIVAALLVFYFNGTVEYFTPAVRHEHRGIQPLAAILAEAMTAAARAGMRRWNWGGTWESQTGVYRFKRKWGAAETGYEYFTQLNDRSLTTRDRAWFGEQYPNFFVLPFSELESERSPG